MSFSSLSLLLSPLVLFFLLPLFASAQPPTPFLSSASDIISGQSSQVYLQWTISSQCPTNYFGCHFVVHSDVESDSVGAFVNGVTSYQYTISDLTAYSQGNHTFWISADSIWPQASNVSNSVTIYVNPSPTVTPVTPQAPPGGIVGDPQFTGLRGQTYQVHGMPNEIFNIVSDNDFQYNSRFVYLTQGVCPTIDGNKIESPCFTHPGTYLGELALQTSAGDRLYLKAGEASQGFETVLLNDEDLDDDGEVIDLLPLKGREAPFVVRNSSHMVTVQMGNFWLEFINSDMFINQRVAMLDASQQTSHGLLGQTWSGKIYDVDATIPWIEGKVWDYAMADHEMFSHRFVYNQFMVEREEEEEDNRLLQLLKGKKAGKASPYNHAHKSFNEI